MKKPLWIFSGQRKGKAGRSVSTAGNIGQEVIPWKQQMILFHPEEKENTCTRVFLEVTGNSRENSARQFMIKYGLTGVLTDGGFLKTPVSAALMLLPGMIFVCPL